MAAADEKCYGVVKASKNDCATRAAPAPVLPRRMLRVMPLVMPKGLCEKLVGGSLQPK